jgi:phosphoketolase
VLPVQHLNGYKIANPTVLARIPTDELTSLLRGYGYEPHFVGGDDPTDVHEQLAITLDEVLDTIAAIQHNARGAATSVGRPARPMIVLRTPKGWTGPAEVDGVQVEGTFRAHQVPLSESRTNAGHRAQLELWLRSYRPEELFDQDGQLIPALRALAPHGTRRMSANPNANGGLLLRDLVMPDFRQHAVEVDRPAAESSEATKVLGAFLRDTITANPDCSGVAGADRVAELSADIARVAPGPQRLLPPGSRVHRPHGQQEGRDRACLAAAGHQHPVVDHRPLPAQPPLRHRGRQQPTLNYLTIDEAVAHCTRGFGSWPWAGTADDELDVVLACAGDVPTRETLAAADLLRTHLPGLNVQVVNVVDLIRLQSETEHPH